MDLPHIFHSMGIYNYYGKSKSIRLQIKVYIYNFHIIITVPGIEGVPKNFDQFIPSS